jgi:hypothetical protein
MLFHLIPVRINQRSAVSFVSEADVTMWLITFCFCATVSVILALSSYVDAQQVLLVPDADINAFQKVSATLVFTLLNTPYNLTNTQLWNWGRLFGAPAPGANDTRPIKQRQ